MFQKEMLGMNKLILTIREDDFRKKFGDRPFIALPQEEIDRHYASIEVHPVVQGDTENHASVLPLVAMVAIHYNYSWLIFTGKNNETSTSDVNKPLSLGLTGNITFDGHNDIFLDDKIKPVVKQIVNETIDAKTGYDLRLAGLLCDSKASSGQKYLGIVFIARLHQQGVIVKNSDFDINFSGTGELQENRQKFDNWSKVVIDHITAL